MSKLIDLFKQRFDRLIVIKRILPNKNGFARWQCRCDCGNQTVTTSNHLRSGHTKSCGCLQKEKAKMYGFNNIKHGHSKNKKRTAEYKAYHSMKQRCLNIHNPKYEDYGGRGINVCDRWLESFENFLIDMGRKPSSKYSLDRIDNDGNYQPSNCRWATAKTQANNRRNNILQEGN